MEAAVSRAFHMVLIGLSYTGKNSAGKCLEQATQTVGSAAAQQQCEEGHIRKQNDLGAERQDMEKLQSWSHRSRD